MLKYYLNQTRQLMSSRGDVVHARLNESTKQPKSQECFMNAQCALMTSTTGTLGWVCIILFYEERLLVLSNYPASHGSHRRNQFDNLQHICTGPQMLIGSSGNRNASTVQDKQPLGTPDDRRNKYSIIFHLGRTRKATCAKTTVTEQLL